jgi:two-component system chemotaxis response regulator CheY
MGAKKVLVVDDAKFMRLTLSNMLKKMNCEVVGEASNGKEALEKYKDLEPEIVTLDITMPVKDGLETVEELINIDSSATIIMCSAMGQKSYVMEAIKKGAKDFIVKPFNRKRVEEALESL